MGKLGELIAAQDASVRRGPQCSTCRFVAGLDDEDRTDLEAALASDLSSAAIHKALKAYGLASDVGSFRRHRKGDCSGGRTS